MSEVLLPSNEEWKAIQGGKPLIIANEEATLFEIIHVYGSALSELSLRFDPLLREKYSHYGLVVDTPVSQMHKSIVKPDGLLISNGGTFKNLTVPSTMRVDTHGRPCMSRSSENGYRASYKKITSKNMWLEYIDKAVSESKEIWEIEVVKNSLKNVCKGSISKFL